jgi:hypothetical protein
LPATSGVEVDDIERVHFDLLALGGDRLRSSALFSVISSPGTLAISSSRSSTPSVMPASLAWCASDERNVQVGRGVVRDAASDSRRRAGVATARVDDRRHRPADQRPAATVLRDG